MCPGFSLFDMSGVLNPVKLISVSLLDFPERFMLNLFLTGRSGYLSSKVSRSSNGLKAL
jgi:hypothetical protein